MLTILTATALVLSPAQQSPLTDVGADGDALARSFSGRVGNLDVVVPRFDDPDIRIDGRMDEAAWGSAAIITEFTQYEPIEGIPSTEDTEVLVLYTRDAIYFGIRALDRNPQDILARLGERDRAVFGDDWVRLMLDTFNDQRQAYVFYVNPLGIQTDGLWIEGLQRGRGGGGFGGGISIDFNPDFIWESDGRVTETGWVAEVKIPYVSLRFRETPVQDWGFNVTREVKRRGFKQAWAPLTKNETSTLAQSGRLQGLRDLRPRRLVEFNPVTTGRRTGSVNDVGAFERDDFNPDFGANARVGLTQNLVLDATVNPDFSQVEADDNRITVNERFALFFPEKRAFFLEGTEIFRTPRNLVHTRRIADPAGGAKLTGKIGSFQVGYLGALDEGPRSIGGGDHSAAFNLVRVRRDVGRGSTVGLLYTDRTSTGGDEYNRVVSGDARFVLGRYAVTTQVAGSWTADGPGDSPSLQPLFLAQLQRNGRKWNWQVKLDDVNPAFRTASGFIPRVGDTETSGNVRYTHFGQAGSLLESVSTVLRSEVFFDHDEFWRGESPFEGEVEISPTFSFRGDRSLTILLRDGYFRFRGEDYGSFEIENADGTTSPFAIPDALTHLKGLAIFPRARVTNEVQLNGRVFYREVPLFAEAARGKELQVGPDVTLRPTTSLQFQLAHTYSRIWRQRDNTTFSTVHQSRVRTQYQFSKAVFARVIVQYNLEDESALRDPTTEQSLVIGGTPADPREEGTFSGQFLLQYQPSPGTIFFIGYTRIEQGERTYRLSRMNPVEDGLFVKLSYLFRI